MHTDPGPFRCDFEHPRTFAIGVMTPAPPSSMFLLEDFSYLLLSSRGGPQMLLRTAAILIADNSKWFFVVPAPTPLKGGCTAAPVFSTPPLCLCSLSSSFLLVLLLSFVCCSLCPARGSGTSERQAGKKEPHCPFRYNDNENTATTPRSFPTPAAASGSRPSTSTPLATTSSWAPTTAGCALSSPYSPYIAPIETEPLSSSI